MTATWYFDFVSPFAYVQLPRMLASRERLQIVPKPIVLGAVLKQIGQVGPAEIPAKRQFTYRFVQWQADRDGVPFRFPPMHPFNSLAALRLCIAAGSSWASVQAIFDGIWRDGQSATDADELAAIGQGLGIDDVAGAIGSDAVKAELRANTEAALAAGVFGVPTVQVGDELFWGGDATPMLLDFLDDPTRFGKGEYARFAELPGLQRAR